MESLIQVTGMPMKTATCTGTHQPMTTDIHTAMTMTMTMVTRITTGITIITIDGPVVPGMQCRVFFGPIV